MDYEQVIWRAMKRASNKQEPFSDCAFLAERRVKQLVGTYVCRIYYVGALNVVGAVYWKESANRAYDYGVQAHPVGWYEPYIKPPIANLIANAKNGVFVECEHNERLLTERIAINVTQNTPRRRARYGEVQTATQPQATDKPTRRRAEYKPQVTVAANARRRAEYKPQAEVPTNVDRGNRRVRHQLRTR